jgi:hypothetical protein
MHATTGFDKFTHLTSGQQVEQVAAWLRLIKQPGDLTELRAIGWTDHPQGKYAHTVAGYFDYDHLQVLAEVALRLTPHAEAVYFTLNPVHPDLLARACNRTRKARTGELVGDKDILRRSWILIDADPLRPAGISSTDEEKALAWGVLQAARADLEAFGIPPTIIADSGNGYHALLPTDLPVADGGMVRLILQELARRHDTPRVKIDTKVYNPARVVKLYGTLSRKGDSTPERPHRRSRIIEVGL